MELLAKRYELREEIGRGNQGITYKGYDHQRGELVAIKALHVSKAQDWKSIELFEREGHALEGIDHPSIPTHLDTLSVEKDGDVRLYLVQQFIDGQNLKERLKRRGRSDPEHVRAVLESMLQALDSLHQRVPPIVHRDIKPSNILETNDGRCFLVDFGAVQVATMATVGGSTVIGTPGYMPMEQLIGRASPASDLYSLGVTLCMLWTGIEPTDVEIKDNKLLYKNHLPKDHALATILLSMIEPSAERRPHSAAELLERVKRTKGAKSVQKPTKPPLETAPKPVKPTQTPQSNDIHDWHRRARTATAPWSLGFEIKAVESDAKGLKKLGYRPSEEFKKATKKLLKDWELVGHYALQTAKPATIRYLNADGYKTNNHEAFTYRRSPDGQTLLRHTHTDGVYLITFLADGRSIATGNRPMGGGFQPGDVHTTVQSSLPVILSRHRKEVAFAIKRGASPIAHVPARWAWGWEAAAGVPSNIDVARENHQRYRTGRLRVNAAWRCGMMG